ncbi:hypothetical protein [uncultured Rikenella sp.]|uniref:hypothetical protein n=1 Tax=uncultured Rikenella sp. TaxID=368003 RepID=UPI0025E30D92|nr:hypothetical protein [uncultured Rikenella sp.]
MKPRRPAFERRSTPGYRFNDSGILGNMGYYGCCWSSATSKIYGVPLNFHSQRLSTSGMDYHAHSFLLRCLSE